MNLSILQLYFAILLLREDVLLVISKSSLLISTLDIDLNFEHQKLQKFREQHTKRLPAMLDPARFWPMPWMTKSSLVIGKLYAVSASCSALGSASLTVTPSAGGS